PEFSRLADASADGLVADKTIHVSSSVVLLLLARGDRAWLATCTDIAGLRPIVSLDRQCCRYSACAQRPSAETSACIASVSLCSPFPSKVCPFQLSHFKGAVQRRRKFARRPMRMKVTSALRLAKLRTMGGSKQAETDKIVAADVDFLKESASPGRALTHRNAELSAFVSESSGRGGGDRKRPHNSKSRDHG